MSLAARHLVLDRKAEFLCREARLETLSAQWEGVVVEALKGAAGPIPSIRKAARAVAIATRSFIGRVKHDFGCAEPSTRAPGAGWPQRRRL